MINTKFIKKYYDKRSACQVLGILMKEPYRIQNQDYFLNERDFSNGLHEVIFICIYNLANQDIKEITIGEIEGYLASTNPISYKKIFDNNENTEWLHGILQDANSPNYTYYYNKVKKMSLLRSYLEQGINISDILNIDELDPIKKQHQQEEFDNMTIEDIIFLCDKKVLMAKKDFIIRNDSESRKAGDNAEILYETLKESSSYGLGLESEYLNAITRGMQKKKFYLETRNSGSGKSRISIKRLLLATAPYVWDFEKKDFIKNPNGTNNSALYIGTEMDLYEEIEPMMWAFISGVEEIKIKNSTVTKEEDKRIKKAIEILKDTQLYQEHNPNFSVSYLWKTIEDYKKEYDIVAVGLDYIELTPNLIGEYTSNTKGMGVREDQVLLNLSTNLKNIAEDIDVFMMAFTQTTDEARRDEIRDQRAVKGARSLPNKADVGVVVFEPTKKELGKIDAIVTRKGIVRYKTPNICHSFYKLRGGIQQHKDIKVWGYQDLGTMEYVDMFCTDKDYKLVNVNPIKIEFLNDKMVVF